MIWSVYLFPQAMFTALSFLATIPLGELFFFHMILIRKVLVFQVFHLFALSVSCYVSPAKLFYFL